MNTGALINWFGNIQIEVTRKLFDAISIKSDWSIKNFKKIVYAEKLSHLYYLWCRSGENDDSQHSWTLSEFNSIEFRDYLTLGRTNLCQSSDLFCALVEECFVNLESIIHNLMNVLQINTKYKPTKLYSPLNYIPKPSALLF